MAAKLTERQRTRRIYLLNAYIMFHMRNAQQKKREHGCMYLLFLWASLGGTREEAATLGGGNA